MALCLSSLSISSHRAQQNTKQEGYNSFRTSNSVLHNLLGQVVHEILHTFDILRSFAYLTNPINEKRIINCLNYDLRSHTKHTKVTVKYCFLYLYNLTLLRQALVCFKLIVNDSLLFSEIKRFYQKLHPFNQYCTSLNIVRKYIVSSLRLDMRTKTDIASTTPMCYRKGWIDLVYKLFEL